MSCLDFEKALSKAQARAVDLSSNLQGKPVKEQEQCAGENGLCPVYAIAQALDGRLLSGENFKRDQICPRSQRPPE